MSLTWSTVEFHLQNRVSVFLLFSVERGLVGIPLTVLDSRCLSVLKALRPLCLGFVPVVCWDAAVLNSDFTV